jgi:hypothetical protein
MRRLAIVPALLAVVLVAPGPAQAARSKCQRLNGTDLAPAKTVKLVVRANADDGTDLVGCVLPRGKLVEAASSEDLFTTQYGYALRQVAGRIVLVSSTYSSQYAYSEGTRVVDLRSGRAYSIAYLCQQITGDNCGEETVAPAAFVTKLGRAVAAISGPGGMTVATFDPLGRRRDLDTAAVAELAPESLRLAGVNAYWTHGGQPRVADISSPD